MIYSDNTIAQKITSNSIRKPNEWSHSQVTRKQRKTMKTIDANEGKTTPSLQDKTNSQWEDE